MTWPTPDSDADLVSTDVTGGTNSPATARSSLFLPLVTRFNNLKALLNTIISNGQPLTLGGSEAATAFVNAAFGSKFGNVARADANTLDWYEEGTWAPVATFGSANVGMSGGYQTGRFTRIGNLVFYSCQCTWTTKGSSTGILRVSLPYYPSTAAIQPVSGTTQVIGVASGVTLHSPAAQANTDSTKTLSVFDFDAGSPMAYLTDSSFAPSSGTQQGIVAYGFYFTA